MYSEHQAYYEAFSAGYWVAEDAEECRCQGSGWALSEVDTWHKCRIHYKGQAHPEDSSAAYVVSVKLRTGRRFAVCVLQDDGTVESLEHAKDTARRYQVSGGREVKLSRVHGHTAIEKAEAQVDKMEDWASDSPDSTGAF